MTAVQRLMSVIALCLLGGVFGLTGCSGIGQPAAPATPTLSAQERQGELLFAEYCSPCHSRIQNEVIVGPSLAGVATRAENRVEGMAAQDYIRQSIQHPDAYIVAGFDDLMPSSLGKTLSGEEVDAIVAYLLTLN